ncbi:Crp/Fnr family transcriptional regulator [Actinomadura viridis]|uniref:CRP-like cAMP-binding protein n=2 Tax=Actinomadura viridis TaxID=58110 RepID=A0A931DQD5_9ACTN|nr:CRP-like cAMP-binding protein [Actinomadura viridis]
MVLSEDAWKHLVSLGGMRRHEAGTTLLLQGDPPAFVLALVSGRVKVVQASADGDSLVLAVRGPGEILGDYSVLGDTPRSATVIAVDRCETRSVPADRFLAFVRAHGLEAQLFRHAIGRILEGETWRAEMATLPAGPRLASTLIRFSTPGHAVRADVELDQTELGRATGLARSTVAAELSRLRDLGLITTGRRRVTITDPAGLRTLAGSGRRYV